MKLIKNITFMSIAAIFLSVSAFSANADIGRKIFMQKSTKKGITGGNCLACHDVSGESIDQPGMLGPKLANLNLWPEKAIYDKLYDPTVTNPISAMPPFGANAILSEEELQHVVAYLKTIK